MAEKIDYGEVMSRIKGDVDYVAEEAYNKGYEQATLIWRGKTNEESYQRGLSEGHDIGYKKGLKDGKQTAVGAAELREKLEYQRGLSEGNDIGYKDGVKDGRNEAWEVAKKLFSTMADSDTEKVFPIEWNSGGFKALMNLQPQEAIERLKSYEDDKIKRGDIVNIKGSCNDGLLGVVTKVWEDNCYIVWGDGSGGAWCKDSVVKTSKHIDVDKFLGGLSSDN